MSLPSLQDIHYFAIVAKTGSLAAAAEQLDVSTAALSKAMRRLESACNSRLFKRTARSIHLSEAGHAFARHATHLLDRWYGAVDDLAELADTTTGTVILSASSAFARLSILPLLPEFSRQFPGIVLDLRLEDQYVDLKNGDTDLLIRVGLLQDEDIIARPLMPLDMVYGATPAYLATHGEPDNPHALKQHQTIGFRLPASKQLMPWQFQQANHVFSIDPSHRFIVNSPDAIQDLILQDQGIGLLNRHLAQPLINNGHLRPVLTDWMPPHERGIYLCYLDRQWMPRKLSSVIEFLMSQLSTAA